MHFSRSSHQRCSIKKGVLKYFTKFTRKQLCQSVFFWKSCRPQTSNFLKRDTLAQVFSCEFCEFFKNTFFYRTTPVAASVFQRSRWLHYGNATLPVTFSDIYMVKMENDVVIPLKPIFYRRFIDDICSRPEADLGLLQHPRSSTLW